MSTGKSLLNKFGRAPVEPSREGFTSIYGGIRAKEILQECKDLDAQLDEIWPGWRERKPFAHLPYQALERVKWLLFRREQLFQGRADWGIKVLHSHRNRTMDGQPFPRTIAVRPPPGRSVLDIPDISPRPKSRLSLPILSAKTGMPLEVVEEAIAAMPDGTNAVTWLADWAAKKKPKKKAKPKPRAKPQGDTDEAKTGPAPDTT
jgi:hypothetical protein